MCVTTWTAFLLYDCVNRKKQLRDCVKLIKKQMMMNDDVEMNEKLRDCVEMKNDHRVMFWEHGTGK